MHVTMEVAEKVIEAALKESKKLIRKCVLPLSIRAQT